MNTLKLVVVVLFAAFMLLYALAGIQALLGRMRTRRTLRERAGKMEAAAKALGWSWTPSPPLDVIPGRTRFHFFRTTTTRPYTYTVHNFMTGRKDGVDASVFDYHVDAGSGDKPDVRRHTVVHLRSAGLALPEFTVEPAISLVTLLPTFMGGMDRKFLERPGFDENYKLGGPSRSAVNALFSPAVTAFFTGAKQGWSAAGEGEDLFLWGPRWSAEAPRAPDMLASAMELLGRLRAAADARA